MSMASKQIWVCSVCGRGAEDSATRGWLIGSHKDPEKHYYGEMVIRCPQHVTDYAIRNVVGGRKAIR